MRRTLTSKFVAWIGVILVGALTYTITLSAAKRVGSADQAVGEAAETVETAEGPSDGGAPVIGLGKSIVSRGRMVSMSVTPDLRGVHVNGLASIQDSRFGSRYLWWLGIYKASDYERSGDVESVFERAYADQIFTPPPAQLVGPTFEELIQTPLPPGEYVVELGVS
jgi:hypothetical protein